MILRVYMNKNKSIVFNLKFFVYLNILFMLIFILLNGYLFYMMKDNQDEIIKNTLPTISKISKLKSYTASIEKNIREILLIKQAFSLEKVQNDLYKNIYNSKIFLFENNNLYSLKIKEQLEKIEKTVKEFIVIKKEIIQLEIKKKNYLAHILELIEKDKNEYNKYLYILHSSLYEENYKKLLFLKKEFLKMPLKSKIKIDIFDNQISLIKEKYKLKKIIRRFVRIESLNLQIEEINEKLLKNERIQIKYFEDKFIKTTLALAIAFLLSLFVFILFIHYTQEISKRMVKLKIIMSEYVNGKTPEVTIVNNDEIAIIAKNFLHFVNKVSLRELELNEAKEKAEESTKKMKDIYKHSRDSIEYASLIQSAVVSQPEDMSLYFKDYFVTWTPKDTVGGDIWLLNDLRHEDECLLFFIDCTGHGVPGAFVTMIVKAVEREIATLINADEDMDISPAWVMQYFNRAIKQLLRQETQDSLSNAGWDGGIIYYNKRMQILKFAGAETPLFYIDENEEFQIIKGNRYSVGYKKCDMNYEYKETVINVKEGMKFYCTTDGYLDQNGGVKDFPFGKKRFTNIIKEHYKEPMSKLQTIFMTKMMDYEAMVSNNDRNDDMTLIAFEIGKQSDFKKNTIEEIVKYEGVMTQNVIATCMDNCELKIIDKRMMGRVSTITIEYCQNMMHYSKGLRVEDANKIVPAGNIEVQYHTNNEYYEIISTNIISIKDRDSIEPKLIEIQNLDKVGIRKRYRELRKLGVNTHEKGGGIGMYEIAKISDGIEYEFKAITEDKYYFMMKSFVR